MWTYRAQLVQVVDGDTLDLDVDLGFTVHVRIRVRLLGVDTPEVYGVKQDSAEYKRGKIASEFTRQWLEASCPDGACLIVTRKTGKYGRWLATVQAADGSETLNEALARQGYGAA